jgi:putative transposase
MMAERKSLRLHGYDYSSDNLYFVTICVQNRICCFGEIVLDPGHNLTQTLMVRNAYGKIAEEQWNWLGKQYPYLVLHAFAVMPNHIHGIIEIKRSLIPCSGMKIKSLSELMGAYKTTTSKQIHLAGYTGFSWQRSYYDHIIREEESFENFLEYINNNPANWENDDLYKL